MNDALLSIIKIILAVLIFPVVWACGVVFQQHIMALPHSYGEFFFWGILGFLLLFLFFYQFWGVYEFGQRVMTSIFQVTFPIGKIFLNIIPFYLTVILLLYYVMTNFLGIKITDFYFMFFSGFAFAMHILLMAQDMQQQEKTLIKPAYLFAMGIVTVLMIFVTVLLLDLVFKRFTFPEFFDAVSEKSWDVYSRIGSLIVGRKAG
ncbi:MAG TPA: hypothetical protein PKV41_01075 [Candidatus Omnitrophota bacterium]|nr:hypothetical protein [Candidatus Omnitrophota bacterium]